MIPTPRKPAPVGGAWVSALGAAALVAAVLSVAGAAPVAIDTPEQWADAREVLNVFSGMFLGYFAFLIVPAILMSLLTGRLVPGATAAEVRMPWLVGGLFALVSLADVALTAPGESAPSLRARAASLAVGLLASLGAGVLVRLVLRGPLRAAGAALGATAILGGVGALIAVVWLRGLEAGTAALVVGCAAAGAAALAGVAAAARVELRPFLMIGLLGGFTTFSAFSLDTVRLMMQQSYGQAALNVVASVGLCLLGTALGVMAGRYA